MDLPVSREVLAIASTIATSYCWSALPILADALEEAGCSDDKLLSLLRNEPLNIANMSVLSSIVEMRGKT